MIINKQNKDTTLIINKLANSFEEKGFFQKEFEQNALKATKQFVLFQKGLKQQQPDQNALINKNTITTHSSLKTIISFLRDSIVLAIDDYCFSIPPLRHQFNRNYSFLKPFKKELSNELLVELSMIENKKDFYSTIASLFHQTVTLFLLNNEESFANDYQTFLRILGVYDDAIENHDSFELKEYSINELIDDSILADVMKTQVYSEDAFKKASVLLPNELSRFQKTLRDNSFLFKKNCLESLYGKSINHNELIILLLYLRRLNRSSFSSPELLQNSSLAAVTMLESVENKQFEFNDEPSLERIINKPVFFSSYTIEQALLLIDSVMNDTNKTQTIIKQLEELMIINTILAMVDADTCKVKTTKSMTEFSKHYNEFLWLKLERFLTDNQKLLIKQYYPCLENFMNYSIQDNRLIIHELYKSELLINNSYGHHRLELLLSTIPKKHPFVEEVVIDQSIGLDSLSKKQYVNKECFYKRLLINDVRDYKGGQSHSLKEFYKRIRKELKNYNRFQLLLTKAEREYVVESIKLLKANLEELESLIRLVSISFYDFFEQGDFTDYSQEKKVVLELLKEY